MSPLVKDAIDCLKAGGFDDVELIEEQDDPHGHGDGRRTALFRIGRLLVRLYRDPIGYIVELASPSSPEIFYDFDDLDIAMGWRSATQIAKRQELEPMASVLGRLLRHRLYLEDAFSSEQEPITRARLMAAAQERARAMFPDLPRPRHQGG